MTIRKYENMKRPIITAVLVTVVLLTAEAQSVTYNHDDAVMNQVTVQETGSGSLTPDLYYDVFHKSYRNSASETNKLSYRTMTAAYMKLQEPYAEKIDSDLVKRAKVEAANLLDREVDAVWLVEKGKVNGALDRFREHIEEITLVGGSYKTYEDWKEVYDMIVSGVQYIQGGYIPNSERQTQYLQICKDVKQRDALLLKQLRILKERRGLSWSNRKLQRPDGLVRKSSLNGITRWKIAAVQAIRTRR